MKNRRRKWFMYAIVAVLVAWSLLHITELSSVEGPKEPAERMLFQVSLFQMELLGSHLAESAKAANTDDLNDLRQAAYTASYAHEHLVLAFGKDKLGKLDTADKVLQYVLRLQVGGTRRLKPEEQQTLTEASKKYGELFEAYSRLLSTGNDIVGSQEKRLKEADAAVAALLGEKLKP